MGKILSLVELNVKRLLGKVIILIIVGVLVELGYGYYWIKSGELYLNIEIRTVLTTEFIILVGILEYWNITLSKEIKSLNTINRLPISENELFISSFISNFLFASLMFLVNVLMNYLIIKMYVVNYQYSQFNELLMVLYFHTNKMSYFTLRSIPIHYVSIICLLLVVGLDLAVSTLRKTYYLPYLVIMATVIYNKFYVTSMYYCLIVLSIAVCLIELILMIFMKEEGALNEKI